MRDVYADGPDVQEEGGRCEAMPLAQVGVRIPAWRGSLLHNDRYKGRNRASQAPFPPCEGGGVELVKIGEVWLGEARVTPLLNEELPLCCGPSDHDCLRTRRGYRGTGGPSGWGWPDGYTGAVSGPIDGLIDPESDAVQIRLPVDTARARAIIVPDLDADGLDDMVFSTWGGGELGVVWLFPGCAGW